MTNLLNCSILRRAAVVAVASSLMLSAAPPKVSKRWSQLSAYLYGKYVTVVLKGGGSQAGRFVSATPDVLTLEGGKTVSRDLVVGLSAAPVNKSNLEKLGEVLHRGYKDSFESLFSPAAPLGIVGVPAVTAYAVVATPFCALGDLFGDRKQPAPVEIQILPDPMKEGDSK